MERDLDKHLETHNISSAPVVDKSKAKESAMTDIPGNGSTIFDTEITREPQSLEKRMALDKGGGRIDERKEVQFIQKSFGSAADV